MVIIKHNLFPYFCQYTALVKGKNDFLLVFTYISVKELQILFMNTVLRSHLKPARCGYAEFPSLSPGVQHTQIIYT